MSTVLQLHDNKNIWNDKDSISEIKKLFAPRLSDIEFRHFVKLGQLNNLNPFAREIWCIKYSDRVAAQVFVGRDGYRKAAQSYKDYDYHQADAVYEKDNFEICNGEIKHSYKLADRGKLIGAYCITKRHNSTKPIYVFVTLEEYNAKQGLWITKPATMIKKVAECQCLRAAFQDLLGGTYCPEEMDLCYEPRTNIKIIDSNTQTEKFNQILENNIVDIQTGEIINDKISAEQKDKIMSIMHEHDFTEERKIKALTYYTEKFNVESIDFLTNSQAQQIIIHLSEKIK